MSSAPGRSPRRVWGRRWCPARPWPWYPPGRTGRPRGLGLRLSGKTQLAISAAESLWQSHGIELLVWGVATSRTSVLAAYGEAAAAISGSTTARDAESVAARFIGWLNETGRPWLVVRDDLSSTTDLRGLWLADGPAEYWSRRLIPCRCPAGRCPCRSGCTATVKH